MRMHAVQNHLHVSSTTYDNSHALHASDFGLRRSTPYDNSHALQSRKAQPAISEEERPLKVEESTKSRMAIIGSSALSDGCCALDSAATSTTHPTKAHTLRGSRTSTHNFQRDESQRSWCHTEVSSGEPEGRRTSQRSAGQRTRAEATKDAEAERQASFVGLLPPEGGGGVDTHFFVAPTEQFACAAIHEGQDHNHNLGQGEDAKQDDEIMVWVSGNGTEDLDGGEVFPVFGLERRDHSVLNVLKVCLHRNLRKW